jgi:serine/threonine-protein kinase HSL1, negative regulator of Swe1 kinase
MAARRPLGDATQRINNRAVDLHDLEGGTVPNARPAHKYLKSVNSHLQSVQATASAVLKENVQHPAPIAGATAREDESGQHVQPMQPGEDKRASVHSNVSSGASSKVSRQLKTHVGPWQLGRTLGQGSSGRVRAARHIVTHLPAAVKIVSKKTSRLTQAPSLAKLDHIDKSQPLSVDGVRRMPLAIEREIAIMKLTEHPNIVKLYDIWENRSEMLVRSKYVTKNTGC